MIFRFLSALLMTLGAILVFIERPFSILIPYSVILVGSVLGIAFIFKKYGIKKAIVPLAMWVFVFVSVMLMMLDVRLDWSEGLNALAWLIPIYAGAIIAIITTIIFMFKKF